MSELEQESGVPFRRLRETEVTSFVDQTIFRKNVKNLDGSLLMFRPDEENNLQN